MTLVLGRTQWSGSDATSIMNYHLSISRFIFMLGEGLLIFAGIFLATALRFSSDLWSVLTYQDLLPKTLLVTVVCQLCLYYNDLYGEELSRFGREILVKLLQALAGASLFLFAFYYLFPVLQLGRGIFLITLFLLPMLLAAWRWCYGQYLCKAFRTKALIIGTDALAKSVGRELVRKPELGYEVVGFVDKDPERIGAAVVNPRVIADYETLTDAIARHNVQHVIVALDDRRGQLPLESLLATRLRGVQVEDGIGFYERTTGKIAVEQLRPSWLIFGQGFRKGKLVQLVKRLEDLTLAMVGLILSSPLFLFLSIAIKLTSSGPVLYRQERVGEGGKIFTLYKFRSMNDNAEKGSGPVWAQTEDPRVTPLGGIMRKLRLDELPQMVNVLKGEMSFVGPRPERMAFVQQLREQIPYYDLRFSAKPGITGWAQVRYDYGGTVEGALEKLQHELYYIKHMSLVFDLMILFETVKVVLFQRGAR